MNKCIVIGVVLLTGACQMREVPIEPVEKGSAATVQIEMGSDYSKQVWFDLGSQQTVSTNLKDSWELAFDCLDSVPFIYLNSGLLMQAAITDVTRLDQVQSTQDLKFNIDDPTGNLDSLAIGDWLHHGKVVVIDLGVTVQGNHRGYRKLKIESLDNGTFNFHYANLDGSDSHTVQLKKDSRYNFIAYSLMDHEKQFIEPEKDSYDLVFTQYSHAFYNPYIPYLVTGVLINRSGVAVAEDSTSSFEEISRDWVDNYTFTDEWNVIGYDWKVFNFNTSTYELKPEKSYILRDREGYYYKVHFLDFYNDQGEKGYPLMEVVRL